MRTVKRCWLPLAMLAVILSLCSGCGGKSQDPVTDPSSLQTTIQDSSLLPSSDMDDPLGDVDFSLQAPASPDFDDLTAAPAEPIYTVEDGYAYELDPTTLQKIGPALDPITHEPVEIMADPEPEEEPEEDIPVEPDPIPESISLPNTGMFLEDD